MGFLVFSKYGVEHYRQASLVSSVQRTVFHTSCCSFRTLPSKCKRCCHEPFMVSPASFPNKLYLRLFLIVLPQVLIFYLQTKACRSVSRVFFFSTAWSDLRVNLQGRPSKTVNRFKSFLCELHFSL